MKKITFLLSLASLSFGLNAASAAIQSDDNVHTLSSYNVSASRYTAAEKAINANLAELREQARVHAQPVRTELPSLGTVARQAQPEQSREIAAQPLRLVRGSRS